MHSAQLQIRLLPRISTYHLVSRFKSFNEISNPIFPHIWNLLVTNIKSNLQFFKLLVKRKLSSSNRCNLRFAQRTLPDVVWSPRTQITIETVLVNYLILNPRISVRTGEQRPTHTACIVLLDRIYSPGTSLLQDIPLAIFKRKIRCLQRRNVDRCDSDGKCIFGK